MTDGDDIPTAAEVFDNHHERESIPTAQMAEVEPIMDIEITEDMKKCYVLSNSLKCFSWCECLLSILFTFSNAYLAIPLLFVYLGYIGAKNFNKNLVALYFIYLTANNATRIYLFFHFFLPLAHKQRETHILSFLLVILCGMVEILASYVSYLFYNSIRRLPAEDLEFIKLLEDYELRQASINNSS